MQCHNPEDFEYSTVSQNGGRARSNLNPEYPDTHEFSEHQLEILPMLLFSGGNKKDDYSL